MYTIEKDNKSMRALGCVIIRAVSYGNISKGVMEHGYLTCKIGHDKDDPQFRSERFRRSSWASLVPASIYSVNY